MPKYLTEDLISPLKSKIETKITSAVSSEATKREEEDVKLQTQIDTIIASSDVKDIVGTKAELDSYDTGSLGDNDIIKVLQDSSQSNATTYYRWDLSEFDLIGSEGPYYTKGEADTLLNAKASKEELQSTTSTLTSQITTAQSTAETAKTTAESKQDKLTSGTNIKTVNNVSVLGSGNIDVQPTLVSGTNIKTFNGESLLGTGDIQVQALTSAEFEAAWEAA